MIRCPSDLKSAPASVRGLAVAGLVTVSLSLGGAHAPVLAADAAAGKTLALQWCSSCHLVSNDQKTAADMSLPSFYDVAKDPDWTEVTLATFLADPHPKMPNMNLKNMEIANLARYITSLEP